MLSASHFAYAEAMRTQSVTAYRPDMYAAVYSRGTLLLTFDGTFASLRASNV